MSITVETYIAVAITCDECDRSWDIKCYDYETQTDAVEWAIGQHESCPFCKEE